MTKLTRALTKVIPHESVPAWIKFSSLSKICFIGLDVIAFGADQHILLTNYETKKDHIYVANNEEKGDGVACLAGHPTFPIFGFAEKKPFPRIFVLSYPELGKISILKKDDVTPYQGICFSETEHLVALTGNPNYMIQVWYWRSNEMLVEKETLQNENLQTLGCGTTFPPTVCQLAAEKGSLVLWEMHGTVKLCKLVERRINLEALKDETPLNYAFGIDGTLYIVTKLGNVFHVYAASGQTNLTLKWEGTLKGYDPCIVSITGGIIVSGPDGVVKQYKKIKGVWTEQWKLDELGAFSSLIYNQQKELLIGTTCTGALYTLQLQEEGVTHTLLKDYGQGVDYFTFLKPLDDFFVTMNKSNELIVWKLKNGERVSTLQLHSNSYICGHPILPYLLLGDEVGILHLISVLDVFKPFVEAKYFLSHQKIKEIVFSPDGEYLAVIDNINDIYILKCSIGNFIENIQHFPGNNCIQQIQFLSTTTELTLMALLIDTEISKIAAKKALVISMSFDNPEIYSRNEIDLPHHYTSISPVYASDSDFYASQYLTRQVKILRLNGSQINEVMNINTEHQLRHIVVKSDRYHVVFYSMDGKIQIFQNVINRKMTILSLHNRFCMGVKQAQVDTFGQYAITLGHSGSLVATKLNIGGTNTQLEDEIIKRLQSWKAQHSKQITSGLDLQEEHANKRWLDIQKMKLLEKELELHNPERVAILSDFHKLRQHIKELIDNNEKVPEVEKLDIDSFNFAIEWSKIKAQEAEKERIAESKRMNEYIDAQGHVNQAIIEKCWDTMEKKGCQIRGIFTRIWVENYPLLKTPETDLQFKNAMFWRQLELMTSLGDEFLPWIPIPANQLDQLLSREPDIRNPNIIEGINYDGLESALSLTGTCSFKFIEHLKLRPQQVDVVALHQIHQEQVFGQYDMLRLREYFNKLFDDLKDTKENEMHAVSTTNRRLRYIKNELKTLAELKKIEINSDEVIEDPICFPQEQPETIIKVEDNEVEVLPYISPSKQKILDALAAEKERLRLELLADDFRDRALMVMMDGVLEHKWEDEIKKPVWKPKCMTEKDPRDYDETDLESVKDYRERVEQNLIERDRYRDLLIEERSRIKIVLRDRITKFNYKVAKLQLLKMQIDSCVNAEEMRLLKTLSFSYRRIEFDRQEQIILHEIDTVKEQLAYLGDTFTEIQGKIIEFKNNYETLNTKDKLMDKQFKTNFAEFAPLAVVDPAYKIFRRRPKYQIRAWATVPILLDLAKRIVSKKTHEHGALLLPIECIEYMNLLDQMDAFTGATGIDQNVWQILCRMRRAKIESEFKLKAYGLQLAEADTTANAFSREIHHKKNYLASLESKLDNLHEAKQKEAMNRQVQIVMKRGQVEVQLTGKILDFHDCVLVHKNDIYEINEVIQRAGMKKLKAMTNAAVFRRKIIAKEWEHKVLRLTVRDLKDYVKVIDKCKITKEVQMWLKRKERGWNQDLGEEAVDADIQNTIASQEKMLHDISRRVRDIQEKIIDRRKEISKLDIKIQELNLDITEQGMKRDMVFEETEYKSSMERMNYMAERSRLIRKIQEQHAQILELSTMLELQKLRTFPTLTVPASTAKYKKGY